MTQLSPQPPWTRSVRTLIDEMPDPDNLRIDRTDLTILPIQLSPAPSIGERLTPARHRAEYSRSA